MTRIDELGIPMKDMWWYLDTRRFGTVPQARTESLISFKEAFKRQIPIDLDDD